MGQTQLILVGGFLGAGKTTLIERVARRLAERGKRVGIITNDQTVGLVDSQLLRNGDWGRGLDRGYCGRMPLPSKLATG